MVSWENDKERSHTRVLFAKCCKILGFQESEDCNPGKLDYQRGTGVGSGFHLAWHFAPGITGNMRH